MSLKQVKGRIVWTVVCCIALSVAAGSGITKVLALQEYRQMAMLAGQMTEDYPRMTEALMEALKGGSVENIPQGEKLLLQYGYYPEVFWHRNLFFAIAASAILLFLLAVTIFWLLYSVRRRNSDRINDIADYLKQVNTGRESIVRKVGEDDFSHLEDELSKIVTELRQTREQALKGRQALAGNLADIAHQLKTPITSMSLMMQLLSENCEVDKAGYIERIDRQLAHMERLISTLLTLSQLDAGTLELKEEPVDVQVMFIKALEPMEDILHRKNIVLNYPENDPEKTAEFTGDMHWSAEAFSNILKNCLEHTGEGGAISISWRENPLYTEIDIKDNGSGFLREDLPHLFQRFYKGKNARKDSIGIGLSFAKAIVEKQNGIIHAANAVEGGAEFSVKFYKR